MQVKTENRLLEIEDLHVEFPLREGTVRALKGISFNLSREETLGVVGESGCGKSVTGQCILRILPVSGRITQGSIRFQRGDDGDSVVDLTKLVGNGKEIREIRTNDIGIIFQEPMSALSPVHTIGNQIIESIRLREPEIEKSEARRQAIDMLDKVGIPKPGLRIDSHTFELSGGMRQRAMIAMALVSEPSLLIADEPTTAVDVTIQAQILDLLRDLQREMRMAVMYISHDMGVIATMAQRVVVMYWGRIVEAGTTEDVFHRPSHPYTQALIKSIPQLTGERAATLYNIEGTVPHPYATVTGCHFHPRCPHFIPGRCDVTDPPVSAVSDGHQVMCHLYENNRGGHDG